MNTTSVQYDDLFVYAPSFAYWEAVTEGGVRPHLFEGKSLGTAPEVDLAFLDKDKTMDAFLRPEDFAQARKKGVTVGRRALKRVQRRVLDELLPLVLDHDNGKTWNTDFKADATKVMKRAWREVFVAGVRSTGITGSASHAPVEFSKADEKWLKSAMQHEMRFLNSFVSAVTEQSYKMPLERRTKMYVDALESFYDSARVIGLPATSVFRWTGKKDKRVCESCQYLKDNSPYHKKNLPTTPRSGMTVCLTNCRDRLLVRVVSSEDALKVLAEGPSRNVHIKRLRAIKRKHHGGGRKRLREDLYYAREPLLQPAVGCDCCDG